MVSSLKDFSIETQASNIININEKAAIIETVCKLLSPPESISIVANND